MSETPEALENLDEFEFQEELDDVAELQPEGLQGGEGYTASQMLHIREGEQHEYDREAWARELD